MAIAAVFDGTSREDAAIIGGMDCQTLRFWAMRFNQQGLDGLANIHSRAAAPKLGKEHRGFLAQLVEKRLNFGRARYGALTRVRSDHGVTRGVWPLRDGRHDLRRIEGLAKTH